MAQAVVAATPPALDDGRDQPMFHCPACVGLAFDIELPASDQLVAFN